MFAKHRYTEQTKGEDFLHPPYILQWFIIIKISILFFLHFPSVDASYFRIYHLSSIFSKENTMSIFPFIFKLILISVEDFSGSGVSIES